LQRREGGLVSGWVGVTAAALKPLVNALAADVFGAKPRDRARPRRGYWRIS
jgi:hypothetical protein